MSDVAIPEFLASLGLSDPAGERARALLEAEGITNPRKAIVGAVLVHVRRR